MKTLAKVLSTVLGIKRTEALIGKLIVEDATKRLDRKAPGDLHEAKHMRAALVFGDTDYCFGFEPEEAGYPTRCLLQETLPEVPNVNALIGLLDKRPQP